MPYLDDNLLVFTDLDGSLLDHHSYSWQPAQEWLNRLSAAQVPVILTTSKTAAEVAQLQQQLMLTQHPFIAENGAMISLPTDWPGKKESPTGHIIGASYEEIRHTLITLRQRYDFEFRGFGDVSPQQVVDWTGLELADAKLAMQREASEPLIWFGNELDFARFEKYLREENLALTRGGRFWHVMGKEAGKGPAVEWLSQQYQQPSGKPVVSIGLGDGPNDIGMLNATDYAVVILGHHTHAMPLEKENGAFRTTQRGPEGWKQGLDHLIRL
ncbi:mannosyl-3-phosphoglycerate phosphatase-related protein [Rouxiella silvae]|uniref:Mannosyl-3-phosphoglycerate phosphatase-related protein n=1 Tax=Rouxiella silvae TaxID=1646373 RepID=A0AA40X2W9_9GAMM|nr:mannosyl-3-phosphoglycerate phosphatase-related protein [Rouxiella silvae]MBF6637202.1 mannosyl-3-phosphoglycerate phosphatase-related protein [Rouxiella silvae]